MYPVHVFCLLASQTCLLCFLVMMLANSLTPIGACHGQEPSGISKKGCSG